MRIRLTNRLAFMAAVGIAVSVIAVAQAPITPTLASPLHSLASNDFTLVADQGFGDPQNSEAWSMTWYKNNLYVGTSRAWRCVQQAIMSRALFGLVPYPPQFTPDLTVPCAPYPQGLPLAGEIWRMDPTAGTPFTQSNWTRVYQAPQTYNGQPIMVNITRTSVLTPAPRDMGYRGMSTFDDNDPNGPALYVSGVNTLSINGNHVPPQSLLRTTDGMHFQAVPSDPGTTMGMVNNQGGSFRHSLTYNGKFYVVSGNIQGGGVLLVSSKPQLGDDSFQQFTPSTMQVYEIQSFNGHLYVGLQSRANGYSVVEFNDNLCDFAHLPCPASAFTPIVPPGGGLGSKGSFTITSMHVFTPSIGDGAGMPHLYIGTDGLGRVTQPAEIVRINPDNSWDLVVGKSRKVDENGTMVTKTPISGLGAGFNWYYNVHMWRMEDYNGVLYVGTFDESTIKLHDPILGPLLWPFMGFDLWASSDGITFSPVTTNGFNYLFNMGVRSLQASPYGLFVGSFNWSKGLRIWLGQLPAASMQLMPTDIQLNETTSGGPATAVLSWNAPRTADAFHVYRSDATLHALPPLPSETATDTGGPISDGTGPTVSAWVPGTYADIGSSTTPYFVDHNRLAGHRYSYYVVAQDAKGNLSAPSSVASDLVATQGSSFGDVETVVTHMMAWHVITSAQGETLDNLLGEAHARLSHGDARGCMTLLNGLRRQALSHTHGLIGWAAVEPFITALDRLEKRVALVKRGVLAPAQVN